MVKLRNIGPDAVSLYRPAGEPASLLVDPGQIVDVPSELVEDAEGQLTDALILRMTDGELRAWPGAQWELADTSTSTRQKTDNNISKIPVVNDVMKSEG